MTTMSPGWRIYLWLIGVHAAMFLVIFVVLFFPDWLDEVRRPFRCPLDDLEHRLLARTLQTLTSLLDAANITYFMMSGTLLGSYRFHDRIPWDDDVDIIVPASEQWRLRTAVESVQPDYAMQAAARPGCQWKFYLATPAPGSHRLWFNRHPVRWPYVDVFFNEQNTTHIWNTCPWFADEVWPLEAVFPLRRRPFGRLSLPAPCDTAATLAVNFDLGRCQARSYDHQRDGALWLSLRRPTEVDCRHLELMWPFVRRRHWVDKTGTRHVTETLWSAGGQQALHEVTLVDQCH